MTQIQKIRPGPITPEGKKRSSMNARTHGLYSRSLLSSESPHEFKALVASMMTEWHVQCATGEVLVNQLAALVYRQSRFECARSAYSDSTFTTTQDIKDFCTAAGISIDLAHKLPRWYFFDDPEAQKRCEFAEKVYDQATFLAKNYSVKLAEMACTELPQLWLAVMGSPGPNFKTSFTERMRQIHQCDSLEEAAELHSELLKERYKFELMWLEKHKTIEAVKIKMSASKALNAISRTDWQKAEAQITKQVADTIRQLVSLRHYHGQVLEVIEAK